MTRSSEMIERLRRLMQGSANRPNLVQENSGYQGPSLPICSTSLDDTDDATARSLEAEANAEDEKHGPYDHEPANGNDFIDSPMRSPVTCIQPQPTLELPPKYHFRTTELGYPIFRHTIYPEFRRATMTTSTGFIDPRVTAFKDYYTSRYNTLEHWELRVLCEKRGLVTYGTKEKLVERLLERALRDAARGWSEVFDTLRRVTRCDAPPLPDMKYESMS
ncbi:hypothetical protein N0V90_003203 [Kalmusia sp. IMI 367209]|nr:hypothetical protein N0V90_003203 [Kalmusia sp. IMI 367209]